MNWKYHLGVTAVLAVVYLFLANRFLHLPYSDEWLPFILVSMVASLLPDVDLPNSKINQLLGPLTIFIVSAISIYFFSFTVLAAIAAGLLLFVVDKLYDFITDGHRGNTHSIWFGFFVGIPVGLYAGIFLGMAALFGVVAHIVEDFIYDVSGFGGGE